MGSWAVESASTADREGHGYERMLGRISNALEVRRQRPVKQSASSNTVIQIRVKYTR